MLRRLLSILTVVVLTITTMTSCKKRNDNPILVLYIESEYFGIEGTVEIEMYPDKAPNTVKNIISLASKGFYDGLTISKVLPNTLVEIGDPKNLQLGGVRYAIDGEFKDNGFTQNDITFERGTVVMSRYEQNYDSAVADFFIQLDDTKQYDGKYAAFGKVIKGLDVLDKISRVKNVGSALGYEPVYSVKVIKTYLKLQGVHYNEPKTHERVFFGSKKD